MRALKRKAPSVPIRFLNERGLLIKDCLDYGCGRGFDADFFNLDKYDPSFFPERPNKLYRTIISIYVLNTLSFEVAIDVLLDIHNLLLESGKAYIAVRRDYDGNRRAGKKMAKSLFLTKLKSIRYKPCKYEIYEANKEMLLSQILEIKEQENTDKYLTFD